MKTTAFIFLCVLGGLGWAGPASAQKDFIATETPAQREQRMAWWKEARFGMFIHWGAYAVPAGYYQGKPTKGIGEWIMHNANIPIPEYEEYVKQFNPTQFDARQWVKIAKDAGMKYIVITSKHHDGFCLWDSKVTNYDIMDFAPFKRDILQELAAACKAEGVRLCFYHSIMDWHQPDAKAKKYDHQTTANPDWAKYREEYLKPQLAELIKKYDPGVLWFDGEWIEEWTEPQGKDLYNYLRNLDADLIINNRVGKGRDGMQGMNKDANAAGDFGTPEQEILANRSELPWETCMTMNDSWGFKKDDTNWKSAEVLIHQLADATAKGGNYLLNVGPTAAGLIPGASVERLAEMGKWMKVNGEAIYGAKSVKDYKEGNNLVYTNSKDDKFTYAIALKWPGSSLTLSKVMAGQVTQISLLGGKKLKWRTNAAGGIDLDLPASPPSGQYAWVFKIKYK